MKKLFLSFVAVIVTATTMHAQDVYVATLNHEGTISEYYGATALINAYAAAVDGDIITLSAGTFTGGNSMPNITKAITLRGVGMIDDTEHSISTTNISSLTFAVNGNTELLCVEGINFTSGAYFTNKLENAEFKKCQFNWFRFTGSGTNNNRVNNCTFTNCVFANIELQSVCTDNTFFNCIIRRSNTSNLKGDLYNATLFNCFVYSTNSACHIYDSNFTNCIIWGKGLAATNKISNCLGISTNFSDVPGIQNGYTVAKTAFVSWEDASTENTPDAFVLSDEGKYNGDMPYLGVDGTEIGVLGGNYPYNPVVSIPRITKCEVANKATADGKLSVNIEVTAPTE